MAVLKIRIIIPALPWKLAQSCKGCIYYACQTREGTALLGGFQSSWGALKSSEQDSN